MLAALALLVFGLSRTSVRLLKLFPLFCVFQLQLSSVPSGQRQHYVGGTNLCHYSTSPSIFVRISGSPSVIAMVFS